MPKAAERGTYNVVPLNTVLSSSGTMTPLSVSRPEWKFGKMVIVARLLPARRVIDTWADMPLPLTLMSRYRLSRLSLRVSYFDTSPSTVMPPKPLKPLHGTLKATCTTAWSPSTATKLVFDVTWAVYPRLNYTFAQSLALLLGELTWLFILGRSGNNAENNGYQH